MSKDEIIETVYGRFLRESKRRLDITYDYEAAEIRAFHRIAELLSPKLMLDIGANIGVYSIHLGKISSIEQIFAFEPAPVAFELLEKNAAVQDHGRIDCRNVALSESKGTARFAVFGDLAGNNAITETQVSGNAKQFDSIDVPTAPLDDEVSARGAIFVGKIDVEGHELKVISGAQEFLSKNAGVLQIEHFGDIAPLDQALATAGYSRLFRMKHDFYYANIIDTGVLSEITEILFDEVARALGDLKDERRRRRSALRNARDALDILRYGTDPVMGRRKRGPGKKR
jgi:FkbM family methyltransferase